MADIKQLVETKKLKTTKLIDFAEKNQSAAYLNYDEIADELIIIFENPDKRSIVHYIDSHVALLYEPQTMEVIGIQVEAFQKSFVDKYISLQRAWRLSECCNDLEFSNFGDIAIAFERQKPVVTEEVVKITEGLLFPKNRRLAPVHA